MTILPATIMMIVGMITIQQFDNQLESEIKNQINDDVASLVEIYTEQGPIGLENSIEMRLKMTPSERSVGYYKLTNRSGNLIVGNLLNNLSDVTSENLVCLRMTELKGGEVLSVGRSLAAKNQATNSLRSLFHRAILCSILMGLAIGVVSAWLFKRRLHDINAVCDAVADGDVTTRLSEDHRGDEVSQLSENINQMLARIQNLISVRKRISDQVAHELRTPLTRLDNVLQNAAQSTHNAKPIEDARQELKSCVALLDGLLDVSSLEAQSGDKSDFETFDLSALVGEMCDFYNALALEKQQTLTCECAEVSMVKGDKTQLGRLIANLIDNAIKYTPQKGSIIVATVKVKTQIILTVSDTGPGIAPENRTNVFTPFFRNKKNQTSSGHGLGLALAKAIADRHEAALDIISNSHNAGACFKFTIAASSQ